MQKVSKIKKTLLSKSFFRFWKYQFLIKSYNKKVKPYKINREILNIGDVVFALCFNPEEKKFYLIKQFRPFYFVRSKNLKYEIVGGLVDKGENLTTALKREIKEELSINIAVLKHIASEKHKDEKIDVNVHYFLCELLNENIILSEHENMKWLPKNDLKQFKMAPGDSKIIKYLE